MSVQAGWRLAYLERSVGAHCARNGTARWAAVWDLLVGQEEEILEMIKDSSVECNPERIMEQTVEFEWSSGKTGSSGLGANDTTSVAATAVAKSVEEARLPGIAKCNAATAATVLLQKSQSLLVLVKCGFLR